MRMLALMILLFTAAVFVGSQEQPSAAPAAAPEQAVQQKEQIVPQFKKEQLEQLVAPIALYPDDLLAQILAGSTYPVDIVEAARWIKRNPSLDQDGINDELKLKNWDPSVKGLVFFPELLARMNDNLDWTKELGDAFLTQQKDLMDSIQVMRKKAQDAGVLKSDENQKVATTAEGQTTIQPTNPETVYVQNYVPAESYGTTWTSASWDYPNVMAYPSWPWRPYPYPWALGYNCGWANHGLVYGNNYYNNNFYRNNVRYPSTLPANRNWAYDRAHARQVTAGEQQMARRLESEKTAPQNFQGGNSAAARELRQAVPEGDRTQLAAKALQNNPARAQAVEDRAQVANQAIRTSNAVANNPARAQAAEDRAQVANQAIRTSNAVANNPARAQAAEDRAQTINQNIRTGNTALRGSGNAGAERAYSNRGAQSRSVSSSQAVRSSGSSRSSGASRGGGGGARGGGGGGRR